MTQVIQNKFHQDIYKGAYTRALPISDNIFIV